MQIAELERCVTTAATLQTELEAKRVRIKLLQLLLLACATQHSSYLLSTPCHLQVNLYPANAMQAAHVANTVARADLTAAENWARAAGQVWLRCHSSLVHQLVPTSGAV